MKTDNFSATYTQSSRISPRKDLRIAAFSWHYARDLRQGFASRGISWDAGTVQLRSMGESFEGCATTWSTMLPAYLGSPSRVRIDYELTVPDTAWTIAIEGVYQADEAIWVVSRVGTSLSCTAFSSN